ncbi:nitrogen fixation protein FixH [Neorhizobium galegae]|uniref:FixH family protein n=1 Tax=Neorhizobium galegae TaxID=399 RepID=UPI001AEAC4F2|nr:FixH family protein [Neorhizobium galegae]MBP2548538.1 nitrogen fixation protein FixH [Neorhizobium galegae]
MTHTKSFVFTGWHMMGVVCLFFGTIISVNFYMAYQAVHSWSGLVVENTYVASQQFNSKVAEAKALGASGVTGTLSVEKGVIRYVITGPDQKPVPIDTVTATFKRPVGDHQDFSVTLSDVGNGTYEAAHEVATGHWIVDTSAMRNGQRILHHNKRIAVIGEVK